MSASFIYKGLKVRERTITSKSLAKKLHTCFSVDITWNVFCTWSISSTAQHAVLQKYFSLSSFSYLFICNPTHKTKTGTANRLETTKSNASGAIKLSSQSESGSSQINTIWLYLLYSSKAPPGPWKMWIFQGHGSLPVDRFIGYDCCTSSKISSQGQILGTSGDALGL